MAKRKKRKSPAKPDFGENLFDTEVSQTDRETFMAAVQRQLDLSGCEGVEEAQAKLNQLLAGKTIDDVIGASDISSQPRFAALYHLREIDWASDTPRAIRRKAKEALEIDPGCCDAYVVLAEIEEKPEEQQKFLEKAVEVGRAQHAEMIETMPEDSPGLWGFHEARPFLQAMYELGEFHRRQFGTDECRTVFEEILRLNPGDNQGIRYELVNVYAIDGNWRSVDAILGRYPDDPGCSFAFTRALSAFHKAAKQSGFRPNTNRGGNPFAKIRSPLFREANRLLKDAIKKWPWTAVFLIDYRCLGVAKLSGYRYAHPEESLDYAQSAIFAWSNEPHADLWLCTELRRWMGAPAVNEAVRHHLNDFIEILDVIESVNPLELGFEGDEREQSILVDSCELASEFADDLIDAAEPGKREG